MDESSSLSLEPLTPSPVARSKGGAEAGAASPLSRCVVCSKSVAGLSDAEREAHVNACLDGQASPFAVTPTCSVCHKSLAHLDAGGRNAHVNRCVDEEARRTAPATAVAALRAGENRMDGPVYFCLVCNKDLSMASVTARGQHVKSCAKKNKTDAAGMRSLANGESEAPAKKTEELYRDPVSGFVRKLGVPSVQKSRRKAKRPGDDDLMVVGDDEELAHIAVALAASLGGGVDSSSGGGGAAPAAVPVRSLQQEPPHKKVDLAGFDVPSLTQVVNEVAPLAQPPTPPPAPPPVPGASTATAERSLLSASKLASGNSKKSLWKKASERPNAEAGAYSSVERTPLLPETPVFAAPTPEVTPFKRQRLEIPPAAEEQVRYELANISNAYKRACADAFTAAKASVERARLEYFAAIGKCAVVRDTAIEALMARHLLHEGHAPALPMGSYAAVPFPEASRLQLPPEAPLPEIVVVSREKGTVEAQGKGGGGGGGEEEEEDGMLLLAGFADGEGVPSPPKKPRKDKEEAESSPIPRDAVSVTLDTPAGAGGAAGSAVLPPTPPHLTPQPANPDESDSQPPKWEAMGVDELKKRMAQFGLQAGTEKFMRQKLREIWEYQHGVHVTESLAIAKQVQARLVPENDVVTPVRPMPKLAEADNKPEEKPAEAEVIEVDEGEVEDDPVAAAVAAGPGAPWEEQVMEFIKKGSYWERMLLFEPIQLQQLLEDIKHARVVSRLSRKSLAAFLDKKGVVYEDPKSKWNRK